MSDFRRDGIGMTSQRTRDRLAERLSDKGIRDAAVLEAIRNTPRHLFMDEALATRAYEDTALPIGHGQTISQPWVVARMTEALREIEPMERVLEVGTGSGYQAAILGAVVNDVYTVERIPELVRLARERLRELRINNVHLRQGDGAEGWVDQAPFDGILLTAAPEEVPPELLEQVREGGRIVAPVGREGGVQELVALDRTAEGFERTVLDYVAFVPLIRGRG